MGLAERLNHIIACVRSERPETQKVIQHNPAVRHSAGDANLKIFKVQSKATGDGIYNCYEQELIADEWTGTSGNDKFINAEEEPTEVEVFNLEESDVEAIYSPALVKHDLIEAWQKTDDENNDRWVGIPLVANPRMARTTEGAPASKQITCNLIDRLGDEITSGLGSSIEVHFTSLMGTNLNHSTPRMINGKDIYVRNIRGKWYCVTLVDGDEYCTCIIE